jgi:hypothetical protein
MSTKTRRIILWGMVGLFLIISPLVIVYAQGYKYSFSDDRFYLTGVITLRANTEANVFIDGELEDNTSFFLNSFSKGGQLPGVYKVSLQKENYSTWTKEVRVEEGFVTDFPSIILLPTSGSALTEVVLEIENIFAQRQLELSPSPTPSPTVSPRSTVTPSPTPIVYSEPFILEENQLFSTENNMLEEVATRVEGFVLSENENKLAYWTTSEVWVIWLEDQNYQPFHKAGDKELITRFSTSINDLAWFRDSEHLVTRFLNPGPATNSFNYKVLETDTRGGVNIIEL